MKKMLKSALALAMGAVMLMPVTAFAAEDEPTLISTQEVALSPSGANTRSAETKEFTLSTYEDNGRTVYSFDVEDEEYRQAAMEYINELTGDPGPTPQTRGILQPGESEYHKQTSNSTTKICLQHWCKSIPNQLICIGIWMNLSQPFRRTCRNQECVQHSKNRGRAVFYVEHPVPAFPFRWHYHAWIGRRNRISQSVFAYSKNLSQCPAAGTRHNNRPWRVSSDC